MADGMPTGLPLRALPLFFFLHIPKTAGTSLIDTFSSMFGDYALRHEDFLNKVGDHQEMYRVIDQSAGFFDRYLMIMGHMNLHNPLVVRANRRCIFFSVLRDPVARVVSHYDFLRRHSDHPLHAEVRDRSLLQAFREAPVFRRVSVNEQLLQIFGTAELDEVENALKRRNYVLGRQERLAEFINAVEAVTGLRRGAPVPRLNAALPVEPMTRASEQPDFDEAVAAIAEANRAESEFLRRMPSVLATVTLNP